jgi:hypothetical protein
MRVRLATHATAFSICAALALCPHAWAQQQQAGRAAGERLQNPAAGANANENGGQARNQVAPGNEMIRGVIAAVTVEGEVILDYRTNAAARTEGTFLTVVGSPVRSEAADKNQQASAPESEKHGWSGRHRHNVYVAWLTPRTTICETTAASASANHEQRQEKGQSPNQSGKKELALDQLEVGDHVEIQFSPQDESGANKNVHQNQQMRQKHGRHRTFVGYAMSIAVQPSGDHKQTNSSSERTSGERP